LLAPLSSNVFWPLWKNKNVGVALTFLQRTFQYTPRVQTDVPLHGNEPTLERVDRHKNDVVHVGGQLGIVRGNLDARAAARACKVDDNGRLGLNGSSEVQRRCDFVDDAVLDGRVGRCRRL